MSDLQARKPAAVAAATGSAGVSSRALSLPAETGPLGISQAAWARAGVIVALFAALFWPNLRRLWLKTNPISGEANWGHAICVPIIGLYYLYVNRDALEKAGPREFLWGRFLRPSRAAAGVALLVLGVLIGLGAGYAVDASHSLIRDLLVSGGETLTLLGVLVLALDWSLAIMLLGIGLYVYGIYPGQNDYLKDVGMIVTLFGLVLMLNGPEVMKIAWFPVVFLICAIPWPTLVYSWVAGPLQVLAADTAVKVLQLTNVNAVTSGTKIVIYGDTIAQTRMLNVAEACAGMRSLMTFISVGGAIAFLSNRPLWQKLLITFMSIPIAIFCNVMRVSGQGLLDHYVSQKLSESFAHQFVGMVMLLPAFFLILFVGWLLDHLFVEELDENERVNVVAAPVVPAVTPVRPPVAAAPRPVSAPAPRVAGAPRAVLPPARPAGGAS